MRIKKGEIQECWGCEGGGGRGREEGVRKGEKGKHGERVVRGGAYLKARRCSKGNRLSIFLLTYLQNSREIDSLTRANTSLSYNSPTN